MRRPKKAKAKKRTTYIVETVKKASRKKPAPIDIGTHLVLKDKLKFDIGGSASGFIELKKGTELMVCSIIMSDNSYECKVLRGTVRGAGFKYPLIIMLPKDCKKLVSVKQ